jgi:hypothetical protein
MNREDSEEEEEAVPSWGRPSAWSRMVEEDDLGRQGAGWQRKTTWSGADRDLTGLPARRKMTGVEEEEQCGLLRWDDDRAAALRIRRRTAWAGEGEGRRQSRSSGEVTGWRQSSPRC